jgi:cobaltochelatase CobN
MFLRVLILIFMLPGFCQADTEDVTEKSTKRVLMVMSNYNSAPKKALLTKVAKDQPFELIHFASKGRSDEEITEQWRSADLVMLDGINPSISEYMFEKFEGIPIQLPKLKIVSLGDLEDETFNQNLTGAQGQRLAKYFSNAGGRNYKNLMTYIANDVLNISKVKAPKPSTTPITGLYHPQYPELLTDKEQAFFTWLAPTKQQAVIAIAIHRSAVDYEQQQVVDAMINGIEARGQRAFAFFYDDKEVKLKYTDLLMDDNDQSRANLMINYRSLHYVKKRRSEFEKLGIPVIHALNYVDGDSEDFAKAQAGISPGLTPFFLVMPEDTGSIDPSIITANDKGNKVVMPREMNALIERAVNHAKLAITANKDKRVATFIWNYPPGEKNIGAAFLDVPASIEVIAKAMRKEGYQVNPKPAKEIIESAGKLLRPYYRNEDASGLLDEDLAELLPLSLYETWFADLPISVQESINNRWGLAKDSPMLTDKNGEQAFIIPRMNLGNLIVLPQGGRSNDVREQGALYHDMKTPINHGFLAIYLYAEQVFNADAIIHLGTHGTQEWLPGKERGLSVNDSPNLAVGNTPVFYPYIIDNVGEAMQAKRRGRATIISHLTPGFAKAGLYADIAKLNDLLSNYRLLDEGLTRENTKSNITKKANELNLLKDMSIDSLAFDRDFDKNLALLQDQLTEMAEQAQPLGVHTFGLLPKEEHLYTTMLQMLGDEYTQAAKIYEKEHGLAIPAEQRKDRLNVTQLEALDGFQLLKASIKGQQLEGLTEALQNWLATAKQYWDNFGDIAETENLLKALSGNYIPVSYGGDPIRSPESVPTGRNLIGFNPAKLPSKEAYEAGVLLLEQTVADYREKHGKYPDKLAFSLWSLETMRHHGALEAQILHALGVRPKWDEQDDVVGVEVIPMSELKRPRIDVVVSATGLYRDAFPNVMLWMADAIDTIAKMKEDNNFAYRHSQTMKQQLVDEGKTEEEADYLSSIRIFSNNSGTYGSGLSDKTLDSGSWETDDEMSSLYVKRMGYAYGKDESRWSEEVSDVDLYGKALSGTDAVIFSRSTNLYALLTNDDPFQYFGGIGQAVRKIDGQTPEMYISNLRRKDKIKSQTMASFLNNEMRGRYFHPRWIEAMQESGYAGATTILDRINNLWGWEVMTPELVRDDQWQEVFEVYIEDKYQLDMQAFFEENNAHALAQMLERMIEANRKEYWKTDEATVKKMLEAYIDLANRFDVVTDNDKFTEFVQTHGAGFGLAPLAPAMEVPPAQQASKAKSKQQITGQKLEQVQKPSEVEDNYQYLIPLLAFFLIFLSGAAKPLLARRPKQEA